MSRSDELTAKKLKTEDMFSASHTSVSHSKHSDDRLAVLLREIETLPDEVAPLPAGNTQADSKKNILACFALTDTVALVAGFMLAWALSAIINTVLFQRTGLNQPTTNMFVLAAQFAMIGGGTLVWFAHTNHYQTRMPFWMETKKIVEVSAFAMLVQCFLQVVAKQDVSRLWLMSGWVFSGLGMIALRSLTRAAMHKFGLWHIPAILIGSGTTAAETRAVLKKENNLGYDIVGQIRDLPSAFKLSGHSWRSLRDMHKAAHVIVALDGSDFVQARPALLQLMRENLSFSVVPPTHNLSVIGMTPQFFLGQDIMLMSRNQGLDHPMSRLFKRGFDIVISLTALTLLSPIIGALAFIVRMDSGKAFYGHKRIGLNGRVFSCLKLRSMIANSDEVLTSHLAANPEAMDEWKRDHKLRDDPRVTLVGAFMRKTSIDELPQLINVLRGDMSIVGPRPIIVAETTKYDGDIAFYYRVRPGITGLWQVSGRNDVTYAERVRMDSWYVRNWSLWHDIAIICKTFVVVFKKQGAY